MTVNKITNAITPLDEIDKINEIIDALDGKADVDLTNVNNSGTSRGASWSMPSGTITYLTLGASGSTYTAPANGWLVLAKVAEYANQYIQLNSLSSGGLLVGSDAAGANIALYCYIPLIKGQQVTVNYNASGALYGYYFIYSKGSESEA